VRWSHGCGTYCGTYFQPVADAEPRTYPHASADTDRRSTGNAAADTRSHGVACSDAGTNRDSCRSADVNAAADLDSCHASADANAER
jgi:hypothetical protein